MISHCRISLCDPLNAGFGYQIRITDTQDNLLIYTSVDPATGKDLVTFGDAIRVAAQYGEREASR